MEGSSVSHADRLAALRAERRVFLDVLGDLDLAEWRSPSAAPRWLVRDVVAHVGATFHDAFGPRLVALLAGSDIETANDGQVRRRRGRTPAELLAEVTTWSSRFAAVFGAAGTTPIGRFPLRIAELGTYPTGLLLSTMTSELHLHLRLDIAPALARTPAPTDDQRMAVVLEWLLSGLEQMHTSTMRWVDRPIGLTLDGLGGGNWLVEPVGGGRLRVEQGPPGIVDRAAVSITGQSADFPSWSTRRSSWRDHDIAVKGEEAVGARFLDAVNVI